MTGPFKRTFRAVMAVLVLACFALLSFAAVPVLTCDLGPPKEFVAVLVQADVAIAPAMRTDPATDHVLMKQSLTEARGWTTSRDAVTGAAPPLRC